MTRLAAITTAVGTFAVVSRLPGIIWPTKFREHILKFPRSILWGRVLMGIAAAIAWVVMYFAAGDPDWNWARPFIVVGVPIAYWLVIQYGNHFLSLRAVAALMLLVAKQMVEAADASDSPLRLVVTVLAYIAVVLAAWLTIAPHQFRDILGYAMANNQRCRAACGIGVSLGTALIALGLFVY
jgi:hypothetical protein